MPLVEMKTTYYHSPLYLLSQGQPFIDPCQQEAVTEQTLLFISLTAVRATTERWYGRMDCRRSQKVISCQGDNLPSQETSICT
jgi:hypothetical protein